MSKRRKLRPECCPYCGEEGGCAHLLLRIDITFRETCDGLLYRAFDDRWSQMLEAGADAKNFDESGCYDQLVEQVEELSDAESEYEFEGGPGMSSTYRAFYASTPERAAMRLAEYLKE